MFSEVVKYCNESCVNNCVQCKKNKKNKKKRIVHRVLLSIVLALFSVALCFQIQTDMYLEMDSRINPVKR